MYNWLACGKRGHKVKDLLVVKEKGKESNQAQERGPNPDDPKNNTFYSLRSTVDQENSPDVVTGMLLFFCINVFDLLHPSSILYFVTH